MGFFQGMGFGLGMDSVLEAEDASKVTDDTSNGPDEELEDELEDFSGNEEPTMESIHIMNEVSLLEAFMDEGINELLENATGEVTEMLQTGFVSESTLVRLDKKARISQLQKAAVFTLAREKGDPKFKKLMTVWKMERRLESDLMKKYGNEGMRRAKRHAQQNYRQRGKFFKKIDNNTSKKMSGGLARTQKQQKSNVIRPSNSTKTQNLR